jgi:hypothetical protein
MKIIVLAFGAGAILAGFATLYFNEASCQRTIKMSAQAELANAVDRANLAYRTQPLVVAKWELDQLSRLLRSTPISTHEEPERIAFYQFLTSARLAKVCRDLGDEQAYQNHLRAALQGARPSYGDVTNAESLFELLATKDKQRSTQE